MKKTLFALSTGALMPLSFSAAADLLREGDALTLTYKNYYYKESAKEGNDGRLWGHDRDEWVQAVIVDYDTGFIDDWLRLEYGVAGADDLYIGDGITDVTNLPGATPANGFEPDGMLGTQTAYVTTRLRAGDITLTAGAGKKARRAPMYLDSDTRILDATSVGYDLRAESEALTLYYTELDKLSLRNEDDWGRTLTNYRGDTIGACQHR